MKGKDFPGTVFDALLKSLHKSAEYNRNDQVAPAVILWPDNECQWEPLLPKLRQALPQLLTLGPYDPESKTGPGIWLRCMIAKTLPEADWDEKVIPILYLPNVSRQDLRAIETCPEGLKSLAELQYRGVFWSQVNAKDWTILAFLQSKEGGLGLDVARDNETLTAMRQALRPLAETPIRDLEGKRLEASDFHELLTPNPVKVLLEWLNDSKGTKAQCDRDQWKAFCTCCRKEFHFDPEKDGEITGGEKLGLRKGKWDQVWQRFAEAPRHYPNIPTLLRKAKPSQGDLTSSESWPQDNEEAEKVLRAELKQFTKLDKPKAIVALHKLEEDHRMRREWVWAELGEAPLARALLHLKCLANQTESTLGGITKEEMATQYIEEGYKADQAVLLALAEVKTAQDRQALTVAITAIYRPWIEEAAKQFQALVGKDPLPTHRTAEALKPSQPGTCVLFADGLRFDVAKMLSEALRTAESGVEEDWRWAALPTVTPTAKPAVSPIANQLEGDPGSPDFTTHCASGPLTTDRFEKLVVNAGFQFLRGDDTGDPSGMAWAEYGNIDKAGHSEGLKLALHIQEHIEGLKERVENLLQAGWKEVRVVTDHGWLLLPGGLPKIVIPICLAETKWGRCAVLKGAAQTDLPTVTWHWSEDVTIAMAPGIGCFKAGEEYSHGSLTLQECVIPVLRFWQTHGAPVTTAIESIKWTNLRLKTVIKDPVPGCLVDLRTKAADETTTVVGTPKFVNLDGTVSVVVESEDETPPGTAVVLVILDSEKNVIAKRATTVGGDDGTD